MKSLATFVNKKLLVQENGEYFPPGAGIASRWQQRDGTEVMLICRGEAFDLYIGRKHFYNLPVEVPVMMKIMWWLLKWWVFTMWCGLKLWAWNKSLAVLMKGGNK